MAMDWVVWLNMVRDEYARQQNISPRDATSKIGGWLHTNEAKLRGLFNSGTSHAEAAKQIGDL
jgi:hypothetical protein